MLKNVIISVLSLLLLANVVSASTGVAMNTFQAIGSFGFCGKVYTTKINTPEGMYRVFVSYDGDGNGITAVRIK